MLQVRINSKYAVEHQMAVIDCLEDPDDTLKRKTMGLLYQMTKPGNVEVRPPMNCLCVSLKHHMQFLSISQAQAQ